jgi:hypothetical protein
MFGIIGKVVGGIFFVIGLLIVIGFPWLDPRYQPAGMSNAGILLGLGLMGIGLYLVLG